MIVSMRLELKDTGDHIAKLQFMHGTIEITVLNIYTYISRKNIIFKETIDYFLA